MTLHYHGTPITPNAVLEQLAGCSFCVSYANRSQTEHVHRLGQSVMLDNGAYTFWRKKKPVDWEGFAGWARTWLVHPTTWAVMPDVIDGAVEDNDSLIVWLYAHHKDVWERSAPVWHMHEPLDRLKRLVAGYARVCIGSSGQFATLGTTEWHLRMEQAMNAVCTGHTPDLHMLRGMSLSLGPYPFASVDSTDVARNHHRKQNHPVRMVRRWDSIQCPPTWDRVEHTPLQEAIIDTFIEAAV